MKSDITCDIYAFSCWIIAFVSFFVQRNNQEISNGRPWDQVSWFDEGGHMWCSQRLEGVEYFQDMENCSGYEVLGGEFYRRVVCLASY